jgi:hypothetical protein
MCANKIKDNCHNMNYDGTHADHNNHTKQSTTQYKLFKIYLQNKWIFIVKVNGMKWNEKKNKIK